MGVGAGLYMYVVVVQKFTFAISSPDEFLLSLQYVFTVLYECYFSVLTGMPVTQCLTWMKFSTAPSGKSVQPASRFVLIILAASAETVDGEEEGVGIGRLRRKQKGWPRGKMEGTVIVEVDGGTGYGEGRGEFSTRKVRVGHLQNPFLALRASGGNLCSMFLL